MEEIQGDNNEEQSYDKNIYQEEENDDNEEYEINNEKKN